MDTTKATSAKCVLCYLLQGSTYLITCASLHGRPEGGQKGQLPHELMGKDRLFLKTDIY